MGPRDENWGWSSLYNDKVHNLYRSPNIVRVIKPRRLRWAVHVTRMAENRGAFKILTIIPAEKRPVGRPRRRWEENIRIHLKEIGINTRNWDRDYRRALVNMVLNLWFS